LISTQVVALALDPVLASYKAQLERETARDFAGPPFGAGADAVGSGAGDADAVVATAAWCCGAALCGNQNFTARSC
jgi:hypothetical protein